MTQVVVIYKTSYYQLSNLDTLLFYNHHIVLPLVADLIRRQPGRASQFPLGSPLQYVLFFRNINSNKVNSNKLNPDQSLSAMKYNICNINSSLTCI
jgi:hypothetical protein